MEIVAFNYCRKSVEYFMQFFVSKTQFVNSLSWLQQQRSALMTIRNPEASRVDFNVTNIT